MKMFQFILDLHSPLHKLHYLLDIYSRKDVNISKLIPIDMYLLFP